MTHAACVHCPHGCVIPCADPDSFQRPTESSKERVLEIVGSHPVLAEELLMHMRRREPMPSRPNPVVHSAGHTCGWEKAFWRLLIVATFVVIWLVLRLVWLQ